MLAFRELEAGVDGSERSSVKQKTRQETTMSWYFLRAVMGGGLAAVLGLPVFAGVTTYKLDPQHSFAQFALTHLMISKVRGEFHAVNGTVNVDDSDITKSSVEVTIDSPCHHRVFGDIKKMGTLQVLIAIRFAFKSTRVENGASGHLKITGDLTIHGVTKAVVLDVTAPKPAIKDPWGLQSTAVSGTAKIDRQDFGLNYSPTLDSGGLVVGNEVDITLDVEMIVPPAK
jgi:polyisoprenoid-binding protein YceI